MKKTISITVKYEVEDTSFAGKEFMEQMTSPTVFDEYSNAVNEEGIKLLSFDLSEE